MITLDQWARIRVSRIVGYDRILIAYCSTPDEVAKHVNLADLCEVIPMPGTRSRAMLNADATA